MPPAGDIEMKQIPDAAVQAASKAFIDGLGNPKNTTRKPVLIGVNFDNLMPEVLAAALPYLTNEDTKPVDVAVVREALEWYAENAEGCRNITREGDKFRNALDADGGKRARYAIRALSAEPVQGEQWQPTHRHVKRGTEYQLIGTGKMQAETWVDGRTIKPTHPEEGKIQITSKQVDMQEVAIYRGDDGQLWARPIAEFNDGRFETLPAAPTSEAEA